MIFKYVVIFVFIFAVRLKVTFAFAFGLNVALAFAFGLNVAFTFAFGLNVASRVFQLFCNARLSIGEDLRYKTVS